MENEKKNKALYIRIDKKTHSEIKRLAAFKYITMEKWILRVIAEKLIQEKSYLLNNEVPEL